MIADSGCRIVITDPETIGNVRAAAALVVVAHQLAFHRAAVVIFAAGHGHPEAEIV